MRPTPEQVREQIGRGLNDIQIAELFGTTRNVIAGLRRKHGILGAAYWTPERRARQAERCRAEKGIPRSHHPKPAIALPGIDPWPAALAGQRYQDSVRAAPPMALVTLRRPPSLTNGSSMAYR